LLELDLRPYPFEVPVDDRRCQFPVAAPIHDRAVSRGKLTFYVDCVPSFGMADVT
jgi:hypothetical protein